MEFCTERLASIGRESRSSFGGPYVDGDRVTVPETETIDLLLRNHDEDIVAAAMQPGGEHACPCYLSFVKYA